ncbi:threonine synthase [Dactylosporangium maewongense]|uniref:Threonine synthase n=1 Tax=Dactylosporangium maewongense TaxID=634393 RepID=A0ABP4LUN9_9ACTN
MSGPERSGEAAFWLECRACGRSREAGSLRYRCASCGGELVVRYAAASDGWQDPARRGVWRYQGRLPLHDPANIVSLGEGATPLVELTGAVPGVASVQVKCEHLNPTGSFKDRIASVALSIVRERRLAGCVGTSSGNGGAAAAAYASRAGVPAALFALADTAAPKLRQIRALGARVHLVDGLGHDAAATDSAAVTIAAIAADRGLMPLLTGGRFSPEAMEGATTIAYEIAEDAPATTVVYAPVGGGGLLSAIGRGFTAGGLIANGARPRVVGVQPAGCPTLRPALAGDLTGLRGPCTTTVSGLQVAVLFDGVGAVDAVRESGGHLTEVTDEEILDAQRILARRHGILVEPAGATAFAGLLADAAAGRLDPSDRAVIVATGAGYKDAGALARLAGDDPVPRITADQITTAMDILR